MNIRYYDESRFQSEYLSVLQQRNQRAYEALHAARENLHASVNSVRQTYLNIQSLSDKSFTGSEKVTVQEFFTAVHLYQQSIATTRDRIDSLALPASMLKYDPIELTSIIDFEPLQNHYRDQLKKLESACDHLISACPKTHKHLKTAACSPI
ncbi:hypothetical protein GZ77_13675 [Endozoicomonas montiporae]|uniref:Uncharacterized protein n=3 Tax=Endozoicomonas montiporae TaxID=1027273 RepID=A0A081N4Q3_9GAMM|nr:hypothetical protein EZMO1_3742 [Endozoicomonas montiporae CL-33]KEQ13426.1 hypothetical protein GZ77_13675 [Endozoicomonas montiporae]